MCPAWDSCCIPDPKRGCSALEEIPQPAQALQHGSGSSILWSQTVSAPSICNTLEPQASVIRVLEGCKTKHHLQVMLQGAVLDCKFAALGQCQGAHVLSP